MLDQGTHAVYLAGLAAVLGKDRSCEPIRGLRFVNRCQFLTLFLAVLNLFDALSTHFLVMFFPSGRELNPIMLLVLQESGLIGFWMAKVAISAGLLLYVWFLKARCLSSVASVLSMVLFGLGYVVGFNAAQLLQTLQ